MCSGDGGVFVDGVFVDGVVVDGVLVVAVFVDGVLTLDFAQMPRSMHKIGCTFSVLLSLVRSPHPTPPTY